MRLAAILLALLLGACNAAPPPAAQNELAPELRILRGMEFVPNG